MAHLPQRVSPQRGGVDRAGDPLVIVEVVEVNVGGGDRVGEVINVA